MEVFESEGAETVYVHGATASSLVQFLDADVPWVWILGHMPNPYVQWWEANLPFNRSGSLFDAEFRLVTYDLLLNTSQFLAAINEFEHHGLSLIQSTKRMPDTLDLSRIQESQQTKILAANGAVLRIYLPHAVETAQVQSFRKGYLAGKIT